MINRREFCLALSAALLLSNRSVVAQRESVFRAKTYQNSHGKTMPYRLFIPQSYDKRKKYPLVLWLHGGAGRGNDNLKQISGGNTIGSHVWTLPENQPRHPYFVVAPQCPNNELWATLDTAKPTEQMRLVLELLENLQKTFNIDAQRLCVAGQSMGGFGTWSVTSQHPDMFAAAIPVCGGNESEASKLIRMPIWAFHGEKDEAVSVERSRKMIAAIRQTGGMPKYTEYKGADHVIWDRVFSAPELLSWVFAQNRTAKR
jgi:predicted peptidase